MGFKGDRRCIGVFGGSFNPPSVAHQLVTFWLLSCRRVDEVWWIPTFKHYFGKDLQPFNQRLKMAQLAVSDLGKRARVLDIEKTIGGTSRSYDTVSALVARFPEKSFRLIVGSDILAECHKWHRWQDLCAMAPPLVVSRTGAERGGDTEITMPEISSSEIRRRISAGDEPTDLVPASVMDYIRRLGLYRDH